MGFLLSVNLGLCNRKRQGWRVLHMRPSVMEESRIHPD